MSELIPLNNSTVLGLRVYHAMDKYPDFIGVVTKEPRACARALVHAIEDECSVAYLECLISEAKKAINRHAEWCIDNGPDIENPPDWLTKYKDEGTE